MTNRILPDKIVFKAWAIKELYKTDDPFVVAEKMNITIQIVNEEISILKAKTENYGGKIYIKINSKYTKLSQKLLLAHELGHVFYHSGENHEYKNRYRGFFDLEKEREANLFAVAFMIPQDLLNTPIALLPSEALQLLMDKNIKLK